MGSMSWLLKSVICTEVSDLEEGNDVFVQDYKEQGEE